MVQWLERCITYAMVAGQAQTLHSVNGAANLKVLSGAEPGASRRAVTDSILTPLSPVRGLLSLLFAQARDNEYQGNLGHHLAQRVATLTQSHSNCLGGRRRDEALTFV